MADYTPSRCPPGLCASGVRTSSGYSGGRQTKSADLLTTIATFVAAGAAMLAVVMTTINVVLTARLNRRAALESWRRDRIHPLVLTVQAASQRHSTTVNVLETLRQEGADPEELQHLTMEARAAHSDLRAALAELELVAPELFMATVRLNVHHMGLSIAADSPDRAPSVDETTKELHAAQRAFLIAAQQSLGIERGTRRQPWRRISRLWRSPRRSTREPSLARVSAADPVQGGENSGPPTDSISSSSG